MTAIEAVELLKQGRWVKCGDFIIHPSPSFPLGSCYYIRERPEPVSLMNASNVEDAIRSVLSVYDRATPIEEITLEFEEI